MTLVLLLFKLFIIVLFFKSVVIIAYTGTHGNLFLALHTLLMIWMECAIFARRTEFAGAVFWGTHAVSAMAKLFHKKLALAFVGQAFLTEHLFRTRTVLRMNTTGIADDVAHTGVHREIAVCAKRIKLHAFAFIHRKLALLAGDANCMNRFYCGQSCG
jgi:hypothetical protein